MRLSSADKRSRWGKIWTRIMNLLRRMTVVGTGLAEWDVEGFNDGENTEADSAEVFGGIGFASRPSNGANAEVIVGHLGGDSNHPVILATRDLDSALNFEQVAGSLLAGETAIFTPSGAYVKIDALGNIDVVPSGAGFVRMGANPALLVPPLNGVLSGESIDPFTGKPHAVLGNASVKVLARKL